MKRKSCEINNLKIISGKRKNNEGYMFVYLSVYFAAHLKWMRIFFFYVEELKISIHTEN